MPEAIDLPPSEVWIVEAYNHDEKLVKREVHTDTESYSAEVLSGASAERHANEKRRVYRWRLSRG